MSFAFGGWSTAKKAKDLARTQIDPLIIDNFKEDVPDYYLFVTDERPTVDKILLLKNKIADAGIRSYAIVNAVNVLFSYEVEKSLTPFFIANDSKWANRWVNRKLSNGSTRKARAVMTFGPAMYGLNRSTDIMVDHFYAAVSILDRSHYYSPVVGTNVFPVDHLSWVFPPIVDSKVGFETYKTRFFYWQLKKMQRDDAWMPDMRDPILHIVNSEEEANEILDKNKGSDIVAWDLETTGLDFFLNKIGCITLCFDGINGYFIPWKYINKRKLAICLMSCKHRVGANLKFDTKFIWNDGVHGPTVTDGTDMMSHAIHSDRYKGLKPLAFFYTMFGGYDDELDHFRKETGILDYTKIPVSILSKYATMDAIVTYRAYVALLEHMRRIDENFPNEKMPEWTIEKFYNEIMMPVYRDFCEIEFRGVFMNYEKLLENREILKEKRKVLEKKVKEAWGVDSSFNVYSSTEVGRLFMKLGWEIPPEINKKGEYATGDDNLTFWERYKKPGIKEFKELRTLDITIKMFLGDDDGDGGLTGWGKFIRKHDDGTYRMHPNFLVMGTSTFRCICKDPNLQQIPSGSALAKYAKQCIGTPDNTKYRLATFDYAALQTRLAARDTTLNDRPSSDKSYLRKIKDNDYVDPVLYDLYRKGSTLGGDMHSSTGNSVFIEPARREIFDVEDENGKHWILAMNQKIKILPRKEYKPKDGESSDYQVIIATDLVETDTIVEYV